MEKPKKNKPYMMYLKQSLAAVKPQYHAYRDGKNVVYTIEGDMTRHRFSVRQSEHEVLVLHKKIAKLFAEYTMFPTRIPHGGIKTNRGQDKAF